MKSYLEVGKEPTFFFDLWLKGYSKTIERSGTHLLNGLTGSFGSSLMERALLDGFSKLQGTHLYDSLKKRALRIQPERVHSRLNNWNFSDSLPETPLGQIAVRQTVGLADPIRDSDIPKEEALNDGLPQSIEAWARDFGIRYFKIKVTNDLSVDIPRLLAIAQTLDAVAPSDYKISLDGNETFKSVDQLEKWNRKVHAEDDLKGLLERVLYIEQPIDRLSAFDASVASHLKEAKDLPPVIIDESDDSLGTFNMAADYGYRGVSFKNCKGAIKGLLNKMLVDSLNVSGEREFFLTGEDLMNTSVVPVQQDLAMASILGLSHVERNGHHYCHGLDHLSKNEIDDCIARHPNLYEPFGESGRLKIQDGFLDVSSLHTQGFGSVMEPDFDFMTPLGEWRFEDLEG
ncbi:MAG: hypothetical protein KC917_13900, partial [Candidatus Omnitrophica bacterium]|nr:hypothetical protein [Candidatus Omnitrophota bacterium]